MQWRQVHALATVAALGLAACETPEARWVQAPPPAAVVEGPASIYVVPPAYYAPAVAGYALEPATTTAPAMEPSTHPAFRVEVVNAVIAPVKPGGNLPWDGPGTIPSELLENLARALAGTRAYVAATAVLTGYAAPRQSAPDVVGIAEVVGPGGGAHVRLNEVADDFAPQWHSGPLRVPADTGGRLRVRLIDRDSPDATPTGDVIGVVELNAEHFNQAAEKGTVLQVPVADQCHQILFVGISVFREP